MLSTRKITTIVALAAAGVLSVGAVASAQANTGTGVRSEDRTSATSSPAAHDNGLSGDGSVEDSATAATPTTTPVPVPTSGLPTDADHPEGDDSVGRDADDGDDADEIGEDAAEIGEDAAEVGEDAADDASHDVGDHQGDNSGHDSGQDSGNGSGDASGHGGSDD